MMKSRNEIRLETQKNYDDRKNGRAFVAFLSYNIGERKLKFIWEEPCLKVLGRKGKYWAWWLFPAESGDMIAFRLNRNQKKVIYCIIRKHLLTGKLYLKRTTRKEALIRLSKKLKHQRGKGGDKGWKGDGDGDENYRYIPASVRGRVWARDGGRCTKCRSSKNLEFDHIIPYSRGGSNSERNVQLLCRSCNRRKYNKITY